MREVTANNIENLNSAEVTALTGLDFLKVLNKLTLLLHVCVATQLSYHIRIEQITFVHFWSNVGPYQVVQTLLHPGSSRS